MRNLLTNNLREGSHSLSKRALGHSRRHVSESEIETEWYPISLIRARIATVFRVLDWDKVRLINDVHGVYNWTKSNVGLENGVPVEWR